MDEKICKKTGKILPADVAIKRLAYIAQWMDQMYADQQENGLTDEETIRNWWHLLRGAKWSFEKILRVYKVFKGKYENK